MEDSLRSLLYPLGFVASIFFSLRFWVQLIASEKLKRSVVPQSFWVLSLLGNLTLFIHSLIQVQFPVACIQAVMAVISFRNINLAAKRPKPFYTAVIWMILALAVTPLLFWLQDKWIIGHSDWIRTPVVPFLHQERIFLSLAWHFFGSAGMTLFALRFFVQWLRAEKGKQEDLGEFFWWLSLIGAFCSLIYFVRSGDLVNILGYGVGLIPYVRNLYLTRARKRI